MAKQSSTPVRSEAALRRQADEAARLAEALRENLHKRRHQRRAREAEPNTSPDKD